MSQVNTSMNFLPEDYVEKRQAARAAVVFIGLLLLVVTGVVGAYLYTKWSMKGIFQQRDSVNAGFEDYKVPTIADLPEVICEFVGEPDPHLKLGLKGLGEPPVIPTPGAIGNALAHALGVRLREAPYTPRRVLEALGA